MFILFSLNAIVTAECERTGNPSLAPEHIGADATKGRSVKSLFRTTLGECKNACIDNCDCNTWIHDNKMNRCYLKFFNDEAHFKRQLVTKGKGQFTTSSFLEQSTPGWTEIGEGCCDAPSRQWIFEDVSGLSLDECFQSCEDATGVGERDGEPCCTSVEYTPGNQREGKASRCKKYNFDYTPTDTNHEPLTCLTSRCYSRDNNQCESEICEESDDAFPDGFAYLHTYNGEFFAFPDDDIQIGIVGCQPGWNASNEWGTAEVDVFCRGGHWASPIPLDCNPERVCEIEKPCKNGGRCFDSYNESKSVAPGEFECECTEFFTGKTCAINVQSCDPNPCENGGTCTNVANDGFQCECLYGWTGDRCLEAPSCQRGVDEWNLATAPTSPSRYYDPRTAGTICNSRSDTYNGRCNAVTVLNGKSCREFCNSVGRGCDGAYNDNSFLTAVPENACRKNWGSSMTCDEEGKTQAVCECGRIQTLHTYFTAQSEDSVETNNSSHGIESSYVIVGAVTALVVTLLAIVAHRFRQARQNSAADLTLDWDTSAEETNTNSAVI